MFRVLVILFFFGLIACGRTGNNAAPAPFDSNKLSTFSAGNCPAGQILKEQELPRSSKLFELGRDTVFFGFFNGSNGCAVRHTVRNQIYDLISPDGCVANGSLWKLIDYYVLDFDAHMTLQSLEDPGLQHLQISGKKGLASSYLRDHAGLRPLGCQ